MVPNAASLDSVSAAERSSSLSELCSRAVADRAAVSWALVSSRSDLRVKAQIAKPMASTAHTPAMMIHTVGLPVSFIARTYT